MEHHIRQRSGTDACYEKGVPLLFQGFLDFGSYKETSPKQLNWRKTKLLSDENSHGALGTRRESPKTKWLLFDDIGLRSLVILKQFFRRKVLPLHRSTCQHYTLPLPWDDSEICLFMYLILYVTVCTNTTTSLGVIFRA